MNASVTPSLDEHLNSVTELVRMLNSSNLKVINSALEQLASFSVSVEGRSLLAKTDVVRFLIRKIGDSDFNIVKNAITCLINMAEFEELAKSLVERNIVARILDVLIDPNMNSTPLFPLYTILLSNLTRFEFGVRKLLNLDDNEKIRGFYLTKLNQLFFKIDESHNNSERYSWIGNILVNSTTILLGRKKFLENDFAILRRFLPQISSDSVIRRRTALSVILNCVLEFDEQRKILEDTEMDILATVCLPLRTNISLDEKDTIGMSPKLIQPSVKPPENDLECRKLIFDILIALTSSRFGREHLKSSQIYIIIREWHKLETNEDLSEKIYELVHVLVLDDPEDEEAKKKTNNELKENKVKYEKSTKQDPLESISPVKPDLDENGIEIEEI